MSFQAYIDNIKAKTGLTPEDFMKVMKEKDVLKPNMKAGTFVKFLADEYQLGRGHSMALWAVFKSNGWVDSSK